MTVFNTSAFLSEAIESVLQQQTARQIELIIVDDGSTDGSLGIARDYAHRFPGIIRVYTHEQGGNLGISASRNLALRKAAAPFAAFLDSDDVWLPHHIETQATLLESMPHVAMVYANAERWVFFDQKFDESTSRKAEWGNNYLPPLSPAGQACGLLARGQLLRWFRADESLVPCICTVVVRTEVARALGGFCDSFRGLYDDQAFHAKVSLNHDVFANDICVARYRQHPESCCSRARRATGTEKKEQGRFESFLLALAESGIA